MRGDLTRGGVVAVAAEHPLARRQTVALTELAGERFALVDLAGGRGYNRAIVEHCQAAGFEPTLDRDPHGPMAWETAVRTRGAVGLTTRASAVSTAREIALVELDPALEFAITLVTRTAAPLPPPVALTRDIALIEAETTRRAARGR